MKKFKEKILGSLIVSTFLLPVLSFADTVVPPGTGKIENPISADTLDGLIKTILEGVLKIGIPIIALAIIYCGFLFVAARGNSEKIGKAKDALIYTLIGAAILLGSWAIALLIKDTVLAL
jgi:hypothetical protein